MTPFAVDAVWLALRALPHARPGPEPRLPGVTRIELATLRPTTVPLLPDARCPHCVRPRRDTATGAWMDLVPVPVPRPADAPALPEAALANPVCGALGDTPEPGLLAAATVSVTGSRLVHGPEGLTESAWSGRGDTLAAGRRRALLTGLERAAARHQGRGTAPVFGSYEELVWREGRHAVLDPRGCGEYPVAALHADPSVRPFDPDRRLPWVWGYSLRAGRPVLVPVALVQHAPGAAAEAGVAPAAGGCAGGRRLEEAILRGLLELVGHDAALLAWYGRHSLPRVDPAAGAGPAVRALLDRAELYGYRVHVFDNRVDLPFPVVTAVAARADEGPGTLSFGSAADIDPGRALYAAIREALAPLPRLAGEVTRDRARLEELADDFGALRRPADHALLYGLPRMARYAAGYLRPGPARPAAEVFADWTARRPATGDLLDDLHLVRDSLAGAGYDVLAVEQTTPEQHRMGLRTVTTVVPGLLPLDYGWHRQRALLMAGAASENRWCPGGTVTRLPVPAQEAAPHPFGPAGDQIGRSQPGPSSVPSHTR